MSIRLAAQTFGVPYATLRRRVKLPVFQHVKHGGYKALFSEEEELEIVRHVGMFAEHGYGYSIAELRELGTDFAIEKGLIERGRFLTPSWVARFLKRNPQLRLGKPRALDIYRAKAANRPNIER